MNRIALRVDVALVKEIAVLHACAVLKLARDRAAVRVQRRADDRDRADVVAVRDDGRAAGCRADDAARAVRAGDCSGVIAVRERRAGECADDAACLAAAIGVGAGRDRAGVVAAGDRNIAHTRDAADIGIRIRFRIACVAGRDRAVVHAVFDAAARVADADDAAHALAGRADLGIVHAAFKRAVACRADRADVALARNLTVNREILHKASCAVVAKERRVQAVDLLAVSIKRAGILLGVAADGSPSVRAAAVVNIDVCRELCAVGRASAVDLRCKPGKLCRVGDLIDALRSRRYLGLRLAVPGAVKLQTNRLRDIRIRDRERVFDRVISRVLDLVGIASRRDRVNERSRAVGAYRDLARLERERDRGGRQVLFIREGKRHGVHRLAHKRDSRNIYRSPRNLYRAGLARKAKL